MIIESPPLSGSKADVLLEAGSGGADWMPSIAVDPESAPPT
jgi:hypothetical protein